MLVSVALCTGAWLMLVALLRRRLPSGWPLAALPIALVLFSVRQQLSWLWASRRSGSSP
jgi:hypothetical protein